MIFSQPGFPPTWEQNGGPSNRDFLSLSEQESHFSSSPFSLLKSIGYSLLTCILMDDPTDCQRSIFSWKNPSLTDR